MLVGSGSGLAEGHTISSGGTNVIAREQDKVGGGIELHQGFVGDVKK